MSMAKKYSFYALFHEKFVILPLHNEKADNSTILIMNQQKKKRFILALGSNCKRDHCMAVAKALLEEKLGPMTFTPMVETSAIGIEATPFLNCLATGESEMTAKDITLLLKQVEQACGDKPVLRSGNIIMMDIDLLLLGKKRYHTNDWNRDYIVELMALEPKIANYISLNIK